jgi:hypothetical protein
MPIKPKKSSALKSLINLIVFLGVILMVVEFSRNRFPALISSVTKPGCVIKGNISVNTGNKNYHLPGMEDYENTIIDPMKGEKWFCTESEAIANGWKKAPR